MAAAPGLTLILLHHGPEKREEVVEEAEDDGLEGDHQLPPDLQCS